jgi:hypothetical protein
MYAPLRATKRASVFVDFKGAARLLFSLAMSLSWDPSKMGERLADYHYHVIIYSATD